MSLYCHWFLLEGFFSALTNFSLFSIMKWTFTPSFPWISLYVTIHHEFLSVRNDVRTLSNHYANQRMIFVVLTRAILVCWIRGCECFPCCQGLRKRLCLLYHYFLLFNRHTITWWFGGIFWVFEVSISILRVMLCIVVVYASQLRSV